MTFLNGTPGYIVTLRFVMCILERLGIPLFFFSFQFYNKTKVERRDLSKKNQHFFGLQECPTRSAVLRVRNPDGSYKDSGGHSRAYRVWGITGQDMHSMELKVIMLPLSFCCVLLCGGTLLILGITLGWTCIPSSEEYKYS